MSLPSSAEAPRSIAVLGSTGSIGRQALDVVAGLGERVRVVALAAGRDGALLAEQARRFRPQAVALGGGAALGALDLPSGVERVGGADALVRLATRDDVEMVVVATGGVVSLAPILAALGAGKVVATANKETLVAAGHLVMPLARALAGRSGGGGQAASPVGALEWLRPIDSEHSAIWQCLVGEPPGSVARLILTGSGGPFRTWEPAALAAARPEDALAHPTWRMGAKITVDSATLMNKGLEVIEAHWLYAIDYDRISVVIHPQSIIHSAVEFVDGSLKAQLGLPDMRLPIQYALTFPDRLPSPAPRLDLAAAGPLEFATPDEARFPALPLARDAAATGARATAALIAADEVAVARFLEGSLRFGGIVPLIEGAVARYGTTDRTEPDLEELLALDAEVRAFCHAARDAERS